MLPEGNKERKKAARALVINVERKQTACRNCCLQAIETSVRVLDAGPGAMTKIRSPPLGPPSRSSTWQPSHGLMW